MIRSQEMWDPFVLADQTGIATRRHFPRVVDRRRRMQELQNLTVSEFRDNLPDRVIHEERSMRRSKAFFHHVMSPSFIAPHGLSGELSGDQSGDLRPVGPRQAVDRPRWPWRDHLGRVGDRPADRRRRPGAGRSGESRRPYWTSNITGVIRTELDRLGHTGVTGRSFRKMVATELDKAGFTPRQIADQLGHSRPSITMDVYQNRAAAGPADAAAIL